MHVPDGSVRSVGGVGALHCCPRSQRQTRALSSGRAHHASQRRGEDARLLAAPLKTPIKPYTRTPRS
eukprot:352443-Chlamydomonas_euryale.AAC.3